MASLTDLIECIRDDAELFGPEGPCPARIEPGTNARVLLVTGPNAGGKSFACKYMDANAEGEDGRRVEFMRVGMGMRTGSGTGSGMQRAMMFGHEDMDSTGRISGHTVTAGMTTCRGRTSPHFLCLDEPDLGLSEEYQAGLGAVLAGFAADLPELTRGLVVVTHSRPIARALLALSPWCIRVGDDPRATADWAASAPVPKDAAGFLALAEAARDRKRAIDAVLNARRAARDAEAGPRRR